MNAIEGALAQVRGVDGLVNASIVGVSTGQVLGSVASADPGLSVMAGAATDVIRILDVMTTMLGEDEQLEDVVVTMTGRHHLVRMFEWPGADGLFLLVTLDRSRTNLALARRQLRDLEAGLVC